MSESVKVTVRCRPLNSTEKQNKNHEIVQVEREKKTIRVSNPENSSEAPREFVFDEVFPPNTSQLDLYNTAAKQIVACVLEGYNGTLLAYGQTGTGKTFTMSGENTPIELRGVIPNSFCHIFEYIEQTKNERFLVRASFLEIYNEQIRDLLSADTKRRLDLKQDVKSGVFVKDLTQWVVKEQSEIDSLMARGNAARAVAATKMNAGSSRSHSIFTITIERAQTDEKGSEHVRCGKLNLVDLAGSERAGKTGTEGNQFKEGCAINLSLSALGNVISALVDGKSKHIPYRDSKLTRLLEDSLGGNSKTAMLANVGPADYNFEETISTLRYASRAKQIKNKPKINEDPKDALIRELASEIEKLRKELAELDGVSESDNAFESVSKMVSAATKNANISATTPSPRIASTTYQIDSELIQKLKSQNEEEVGKLLESKGIVEAERVKIMEHFENAQRMAQKEKEHKQLLEEQLRNMEANFCVGGVNLVEESERIGIEIMETQKELEEQERKQSALVREIAIAEEEEIEREVKYTNLQEEIKAKEDKLQAILKHTAKYSGELSDLRREWETEKDVIRENIHELTKTIGQFELIVEHFIPKTYQTFIMNSLKYDKSSEEWSMPWAKYTGNAVRSEREEEEEGETKKGEEQLHKLETKHKFQNSVIYLSYEDTHKHKPKSRTPRPTDKIAKRKNHPRSVSTSKHGSMKKTTSNSPENIIRIRENRSNSVPPQMI